LNVPWTIKKLGQAPLQIIDGDRGSNYPKQNEFFDSGYCVFLNAGNVTPDGFDFSKCQFISEEKDNVLRKGRLSRYDVVMTTRGTIGNVGFFNDEVLFERLRINSGMVILRCDTEKLLPSFLYQYLRSSSFKGQINAFRSGVAQPQLPIRDMSYLDIPIPPLDTQTRIADILSAYDDLIDNNRQRIVLLEQAARLLYREWFVHLRFPGHEHIKIVDGVPEGWEIKKFEDLLKNHIGGGWGKDEPMGNETTPAYVIRGTDLNAVINGDYDSVGLRFHKQSSLNSRLLTPGDIIFEVSGGSATQLIGRSLLVSQQLIELFEGSVICASFCKRFTPRTMSESVYLYHHLKHIRENGELSKYIKQSASALLNFNYAAFLDHHHVRLPNQILVDQFAENALNLESQMFTLASQIHSSKRSRDLLLPRLMNGEIDV
jgi:type I restriction enzyme S subunit